MNIKRRWHRIDCTLAALLLMALWTGSASADKVVMKNGDQISGTALSMASGKLVFKAPYSDKIEIDWKNVAHLTTDGPMEVSFGKEKTFKGKLVTSKEGTLVLQAENTTPTAPIRMAEVKLLSPLAGAQEWKLSSAMTAGIVVESGNTDKQSFNFDARMELSKETHRFGLFSDFSHVYLRQSRRLEL